MNASLAVLALTAMTTIGLGWHISDRSLKERISDRQFNIRIVVGTVGGEIFGGQGLCSGGVMCFVDLRDGYSSIITEIEWPNTASKSMVRLSLVRREKYAV
jgi:hypothetical protein